jgi:uncharacterized protein (DUF849 family)
MSRIIIAAAVNGNRLDTQGVHIPVSPEEIAADARRCCDAGEATQFDTFARGLIR